MALYNTRIVAAAMRFLTMPTAADFGTRRTPVSARPGGAARVGGRQRREQRRSRIGEPLLRAAAEAIGRARRTCSPERVRARRPGTAATTGPRRTRRPPAEPATWPASRSRAIPATGRHRSCWECGLAWLWIGTPCRICAECLPPPRRWVMRCWPDSRMRASNWESTRLD